MGFEPTPLRNGSLSHRLRPLGQSVLQGCPGVLVQMTCGSYSCLSRGGSNKTAKNQGYRNGRAHSFPVCKVTPVGFEPTPLRNGALSHCLRPLGQSVLGTTFWRQVSSYEAVLAICHTVLDISGLAAELRFSSRRAAPRIGATFRECGLRNRICVFLAFRPRAILFHSWQRAWKMENK